MVHQLHREAAKTDAPGRSAWMSWWQTSAAGTRGFLLEDSGEVGDAHIQPVLEPVKERQSYECPSPKMNLPFQISPWMACFKACYFAHFITTSLVQASGGQRHLDVKPGPPGRLSLLNLLLDQPPVKQAPVNVPPAEESPKRGPGRRCSSHRGLTPKRRSRLCRLPGRVAVFIYGTVAAL